MILIKWKKIRHTKNTILVPAIKTIGSSGADLMADIDNPLEIHPLERILIPTGWAIELPQGYEGQIRSRSGWTLKEGIIVLNSPGTIDSDYRGEIGIILYNSDAHKIATINPGDRIAQLVIAQTISWRSQVIDEFDNSTERGIEGFGSTGV
jgi:dUTP pyrophosphatase